MIRKNPLWVAKQHGHSVQTMLDAYAAWTEGAKEARPQRASCELRTADPSVTPTICHQICHQPCRAPDLIEPINADA